ncbi:Tash1-like protein, putative [Theileria annulata]|uniref:Tash1-like protein, putative n=1 Tax=Theileria annulata TaxID=5874 RepID=Q4UHE5_THEAN|nr:Tash1-like protein, putative [Theileria annulata]CAI73494.1 Tash1-like protein, putative [Theileria annulata]|eukprot:XP_954171.1 Tash1-like protein, putative [Theileria annulata]
MVRVNTLLLVYAGFLYHIKIVSSIVLDLNDIVNSGLKIHEDSQDGIVTTKIYSTPEKKITKILNGKALVWMALPGEYVKCINIFIFQWSGKELINIEIENPRKTYNAYFFMHRGYYKLIDRGGFENFFLQYSNFVSKISEKIVKSRSLKRKFPFEIDGREEPTKKKIQSQLSGTTIHSEQEQIDNKKQLEPETITVEIGSDDEEIDESNVSKPKETQTDFPTKESSIQTDIQQTQDIETQTLVPTGSTETQTDIQQTQDIETQTLVPTGSTETQTDIQQTQDIGIQTKLRTKYPKKKTTKTSSVETQTEIIMPMDDQFVDDVEDGEIIEVLIGSDGEYVENYDWEDEYNSDIQFEISSDSDMDVDESTDSQVIHSDAITQTDTDIDKKTRSSLPLKKRPYKQD